MEDTFSVRPSVCFEVQKITAVSIGNGNQKNYQVQWAPTWVSGFHLVGCEHLIEEFIQKQSEKGELVDDTAITDIPDNGDLHNLTKDDNVADSISRHHFTEPIHERASMVMSDYPLFENQESSSSLLSNISDDNDTVKVLSVENNMMSNGGVYDSDVYGCEQSNPNFEWVERSIDNTNNDEETTNENESSSSSLVYNNELANDNSASDSPTEVFPDGVFPGGEHVKPLLHFSKAFTNRKKIESNNTFLNDLPQVKEEIILVETPETVHARLIKDNKNKQTNRKDNESKQEALRKPARKFECSTCHCTFKNSSGLTRHSNKAHGGENDKSRVFENTKTREHKHACGTCDRICESKAGLLRHKLTHVSPKQFKCHVCGKVFSENSNLLLHMHSHAGQRTHKCNLCEKMFLTSTDLKRHIRVHTGERPFECKVCKKRFKIRDHLQKHARTHRETT